MLQLKTFGGLWLTGADPRFDGREGLRRQLLLLALVAESGERGISRDRAIAFFWPEGDEERGRRSLNQLRYTLRRELGIDPLVGTRTLRVDPAHLGSDVAEFAAAIAAGDADRAAALHAGPFLDGVFAEGSAELEAMIEERRMALRRALEGGLGAEARAAEGRDDWDAAVGYWRRLVGLDPLSTGFAIGLMSALAESDDASGALQVAVAHEAALRQELETAPDARVAALVTEIRAGTLAIRRNSGEAAGVAGATRAARSHRTDAAVPEAAPPAASSRQSGRRWGVPIPAGIAGAVVVIALGVLLSFHRPAPRLDPNQVLVVPLENRTGDSTLTSVGAMAADWITQGIVDEGVAPAVAPRSALAAAREADSLGRRGSPGNLLRLLAEATGAGLVVAGAYDRVGDSLAFEVHLSDPLTGRILAALPPIRSALSDPSRALVELRQRVVGALRVHFNPMASDPTGQRASRPPTPAAYRAFLSAQSVNAQYRYDEAIALYRQAYQLDTTFLTPIAWIAMNYYTEGQFARSDSVLKAIQPRELEFQATDRLSLDNTRAALAGDRREVARTSEEIRRIMPGAEADVFLAEDLLKVNRPREALALFRGVDTDRGWLRDWPGYWAFLATAYHMNGDLAGALEAGVESRRRFPSLSDELAVQVVQLAALGRVADLNREIRKWAPGDYTLDAGMRAVLMIAGLELGAHGYADEGTAFARASLASLQAQGHPDSTSTDRGLVLSLLCQAGRWEEAAALARIVDRAQPGNPDGQGYLGVAAWRMGDTVAVRAAARALVSRSYPYTFGRPLLWQARIAALQHDPDRAMALIQAAIRAGFGDYWALHRIPEFESLRAYPPFIALITPAG
ncbi:MAG: BTAD domain-containing putative transcriptional regulator [Gemmatimonadales bacterium]